MGLYFGSSDVPGVVVGVASGEVSFETQAKTVTPTRSIQNITPDGSYDGLSKVTVNAIPAEYITEDELVLQNKEVTPTTQTQVISADEGYMALGQVTVYGVTSGDTPEISLLEKSVTPTASPQVIQADSGYDGLSKVNVSAIPNNYVNEDNIDLQVKIVTPSKQQQLVRADSEYYALEAVTVNAIPAQYITTTDANATSGDLLEGKTAYVNGNKVTGSLHIQSYYTGSSAPSSSLGANGDIYLQL